MIPEVHRFPIYMMVSLVVFMAIIYLVTRERETRPPYTTVLAVAALVVAGGMAFAKLGQNGGMPWWIYYTVPALLTLTVPPFVLGMSRREVTGYLVLAFLSSPVIHFGFVLLLDWHDYMPFLSGR